MWKIVRFIKKIVIHEKFVVKKLMWEMVKKLGNENNFNWKNDVKS